jgi:hypothetical protein
VVATLDVPLERPRHRSDPDVVALRERALAALGAADDRAAPRDRTEVEAP